MPRTSVHDPTPPRQPPGDAAPRRPRRAEIPPNTGNIARLCAATASPLHLVGPLGFRIDEHSVRRAGVDYWHLVDVRQHVDFAHFLHAWSRKSRPGGKLHLFSAIATKSYLDAAFAPGDALVFGKESVGLPEELLARSPTASSASPRSAPCARSTSPTPSASPLYEALRQTGALATTFTG